MGIEDLLAFCNLPDTPETRAYVEDRRGVLEKMEAVCAWGRGEAPLPDGVLVDVAMPRAYPRKGCIDRADRTPQE